MQRLDVARNQPGREPTARLGLPAAVACPRAQGARRVALTHGDRRRVRKLRVEASPRPGTGQPRNGFRDRNLERANPRLAHGERNRARTGATLAQQDDDDFLLARGPCRATQSAHLLARFGDLAPLIPEP